MKDLLYKVALTKIPLVGAVTAKNLVSYCGGVQEVFSARKSDLMKIPGIGEQTALNIVNQTVLAEAEKEIDFISQHGIVPLFYLDKSYPQRLRHYNDSPVMLYYKGSANLNYYRIIGIVGTRTPTPQGLTLCEELVEGFLPYQPIIISGLAYGIDVAAHQKSLSLGLETVGVLGHGLSRIYPPQHRKIAMEMVEHGGLITEFPSHVGPERENFPMRNRIVAGLCDALIVVETAVRGGSIITVRQANDYNKDVFAIPGRVKDKYSQGCNYLIKSNLAALAENAEDVATTLRWEAKKTETEKRGHSVQQELFRELTEQEKHIIDIIHKEEEIGVDQLSYQTKILNSELASLLLNLEFKGIVRSLPGKRYVLS
jgi:DNA processing protein